MRLRGFRILCLLLFGMSNLFAQWTLSGKVVDQTNQALAAVEVYLTETGAVQETASDGSFIFNNLPSGDYKLVIYSYNYTVKEIELAVAETTEINIALEPLSENLSEVVLWQRRKQLFALRSLKKVEGTALYAGKKNEVIQLNQLTANLAANAPRQIYSQVVGLNIYENGDAGLQLNIGGRGLNPSRSANFNTRQNNYDISADVLGYPESYYTPPAEALSEIQIIRGAASLQYGTQFGGLVNFRFRKPSKKPLELISRQTIGSYGLITHFSSLSGTQGKLKYYTYHNYKEGKGWRAHSAYSSRNTHAHLSYQLSEETKLTAEVSYFNYLAQQAGGLTDAQFYENPNYSNRARNWFDVDWKLYAFRVDHRFSVNTDLSVQFFGLDASREAVGFRENRVSQPDADDYPRELLVDHFQNWGVETRWLHRYNLKNKKAALLLGAKFYSTYNTQQQGPGSTGRDPNFSFATTDFPNYERQASFLFPNQNLAFFAENIFPITEKLSITPGLRAEYIKTESDGNFQNIVLDLAENVILNESIPDDRIFERGFVLSGIGIAYDFSKSVEGYANLSQNFRSVTFSDIRVTNPSYVIDNNITDEKGMTTDLGIRGNYADKLSFDVSLFGLQYNQRLGEVLFVAEDNSIKRRRGNIGDAFIYGLEAMLDWNLVKVLSLSEQTLRGNFFTNLALTNSEYIASDAVGVKGNQVEFIPKVNLKTGLQLGWKNLSSSLLLTHLSEQFTDATNAPQDVLDNQRGIEGSIPAYSVVDFSLAYGFKNWRLETGINNLLDATYFTRRATGYPGPGIIPSEPRTFYCTLQFKQ